jgi:hypothetical protein
VFIMEKTARAELIAALETDKYSGFVDGDRALLETASDERLERFRTAADAARTAANEHARLETDMRNTSARLTVATERIKTLEQPMTTEDFIAKAPAEIKALLEAKKAEEDATKASLISALEGRGVLGKEELEKRTIPELQTLAEYARVEVPDFSGRGLPKQRNAEGKNSYAPPDPYAAGIKTLQSGSKAVN